MTKLNKLQIKALDTLDHILATNVRDSVRTEHETIDKIRGIIANNGRIIIELHEEIKTPQDAFNKLIKYDSYAANHGIDVQNLALEIARKIVDYDFDINLPDSARLHDFGKILLDNELKYKEKLKGEELKLYEKHIIQYGHTLLAETLGTLCNLHPAIIHAGACHHDKHPELPYPHINQENVFDGIIKEDLEKHDKEKIQKGTDIITISDSIITISDIVCAMMDKTRKVYDKEYTKNEIYNLLLNGVSKGCYDKRIVDAYLKSENMGKEERKELYKKYNVK